MRQGGDDRLGRRQPASPRAGLGALWAGARRAGRSVRADYLFHPEQADRSYKNFVNDFCANLVRDPGSASFSVLRCRSSFLCDHLEQKTPLPVLVEISGLRSVESLRRHAVHVKGVPRTNAGLRRALSQGQA